MARGFALVSAVLVAGMVAGITTLLVTRQQYLVAAASGMKDSLRAERAVEALEIEVQRALAAVARAPDLPFTPPDTTRVHVASAAGLMATGRLEVLDGRFNLNSLAFQPPAQGEAGGGGETGESGIAAEALRAVAVSAGVRLEAIPQRQGARNLQLLPHQIAAARFVLLLQALDLEPALLPAILDWLDPDTEPRTPDGAEDDYYSRLDPPYRAANRSLADVSELLRVRGVTPAVLARLRPHVTVLGSGASLDVNTAPVAVLMSIAPGIDRAAAEAMAGARALRPWQSLAEFLAQPALQTRPVLAQGLTVQSSFLVLHTTVETDDLPLRFSSMLRRTSAQEVSLLQRARTYAAD